MILDKHQQDKILAHAWRYGHFRNPEYPDTHNVTAESVPLLMPNDDETIQAMLSMEASDWHMEPLCMACNGRRLDINGEMGPASLALTDIPRCGVPDHGPEYGVEEAASGSGAWRNCDPKSTAPHSKRIMVDARGAASHWREMLPDVLATAERLSASIGLAVRHIDIADSQEGWESSVEFGSIPGGVIGFYYFPAPNSCRRIPQGKLDNTYRANLHMSSLLWVHEGHGHGIKLPHTRGGIMNPSLINVPLSWRNDPSFRLLAQLYGGEPIGDEPPLDEDEGKLIFEYTAKRQGERIALYAGRNPDNGGGWEI